MDRYLKTQACFDTKNLIVSIALTAWLLSAQAWAGVTPAGTRIIIEEGKREVSLLLSNQNQYPVIAQLWVDNGALHNQPDTARSAYMVLPPIFHLNAKEISSVRLIATGLEQPKDRESLYWLNIYEVPPSPDDTHTAPDINKMLLTMRTQMKLIYRPKALISSADKAAQNVQFRLESGTLVVRNPTPHFITINSVLLHHPTGQHLTRIPMLEPFGQSTVQVEDIQEINKISFVWLDDDGLVRNQNVALDKPLTMGSQLASSHN